MASRDDRRRLLTAGLLLGIGLGGFVDGILFHQILQLHSMLSAIHPPNTLVNVKVGMVWDGLFHAFAWVATVIGIVFLWRAAPCASERWSGRTLFGSSLMGWGLFNVVEGVIDHHVLRIHHVVERLGPSAWDALFLLASVLLVALGIALVRTAPS
jgi:uncharacterized membrane protein